MPIISRLNNLEKRMQPLVDKMEREKKECQEKEDIPLPIKNLQELS